MGLLLALGMIEEKTRNWATKVKENMYKQKPFPGIKSMAKETPY